MEFTELDDYTVTSVPMPLGGLVPVLDGKPIAFTVMTYFKDLKTKGFGMLVAGRTDGALSYFKVKERATPSLVKGVNREVRCQTREPHLGRVTAILYCTDPLLRSDLPLGILFTASIDRTIKSWMIYSGLDNPEMCLHTMSGHANNVTALLETGTGALVSCSSDCTARVWRPQPGGSPGVFICTHAIAVQGQGGLTSLALSPGVQGQRLCYFFAGGADGSISQCQAVKEPVAGAEFHLVASWPRVHSLGVSGLLLVRKLDMLVSISYDCTCVVLNSGTGALTFKISNPHHRFTGLVWDPIHDNVLLTDMGGSITAYSGYLKKVVHRTPLVEPFDANSPLVARFGAAAREAARSFEPLLGLAWLHGPALCVAQPQRARLRSYRVSREAEQVEYRGHNGPIVGLLSIQGSGKAPEGKDAEEPAKARDGRPSGERLVASASVDNTLRFWECGDEAGERLQMSEKARGNKSEISCLISLPSQKLLVTGNTDGSITWWHQDSGAVARRREHKNTVTALAAVTALRGAAQEEYLLSASFDGSLVAWLLAEAGRFAPHVLQRVAPSALPGRPAEIHCLAFHAAHQLVVSGASDGALVCRRAADRTVRSVVRGHRDAVTCLALTDGAEFLVSGSEDSTVACWLLPDCAPAFSLTVHGPVRSLLTWGAFLAAAAGPAVRVWDASRGLEAARAQARARAREDAGHSAAGHGRPEELTCEVKTGECYPAAATSDDGGAGVDDEEAPGSAAVELHLLEVCGFDHEPCHLGLSLDHQDLPLELLVGSTSGAIVRLPIRQVIG